MPEFVVISTTERLNDLADGISKCRPLNPNVAANVHIFAGKIEKRQNGAYYVHSTYNTHDDGKEGEEDTFGNLVISQIAEFRTESGAQGALNIFTLENPLSDDEYEELDQLMEELGTVFENGPNLILHRVLFACDLDKPKNIGQNIGTRNIVKRYFDDMDKYPFRNKSDVLYFDSRDTNGGVVSTSKKEFDFMFPRLLADFMMLLSGSNDNYNVFNAIHPQGFNCYSIGYAESMYYFPDVKEFYKHADKMALYDAIIKDKDETSDLDDKYALDFEHYPIGLNERKGRLEKYKHISFDKDIKSCPDHADYIIDECLNNLKGLLKDYISSKSNEAHATEKVPSKTVADNDEEKELKEELERKYPVFINRDEICKEHNSNPPHLRHVVLDYAGKKYGELVECASSIDFLKYVIDHNKYVINHNDFVPQKVDPSNDESDSNPGCLFFWNPKPYPKRQSVNKETTTVSLLDYAKKIGEQSSLEEKYQKFLDELKKLEKERDAEKKYCNDFKLTCHCHHYHPLIDLEKLKKYQKEKFDDRYKAIKAEWSKEKDERTLTRLKSIAEKNSEDYVKELSFIDWENPFEFLAYDIATLADICNNLYKKSSPFVCFNQAQPFVQNNACSIYSDIPNFVNEFKAEKKGISNRNVLAYESSHIASKICCFQFLPFKKNDLQ